MSLFSFLYAEWIDIRDGRATQQKGRLSNRILAEINDVLANEPEVKGCIRSSGDGRYHFSSGIPQSLHQKLRNILASR
jgi:hypothetical protein